MSSVWLVSCGQTASSDDATDGTTGHTTADPVTTTTTTTTTTGDQNVASCPSTEPALATACSPEGLECVYNDCSFPDFLPLSRVVCDSGLWQRIEVGECERPVCPADQQLIGRTCNGAYETGPCPTLNGCQELVPMWCIDGVWQADADAGTTTTDRGDPGVTTGVVFGVPCPDFPPTVGTLCCPEEHTAQCSYEAFATSNGAAAAATGGPPYVPPSTTPACVACSPDGAWRESTGCE